MSAAVLVFKLGVQSVCQLQQHRIEVSFEKTGLPISELLWQIIPYRQSSARQLVGFGVPVLHPIHDNSMDWDLVT